jgi:hypothetical protein
VPPPELSLGEQVFLRELEALTEQKRELVRGTRVAVKRNAAGDLVFAVIVPAVRLPQATWPIVLSVRPRATHGPEGAAHPPVAREEDPCRAPLSRRTPSKTQPSGNSPGHVRGGLAEP